MAKKKETKNPIFIHIKATSEVLSVNQIVPEDKAVKILEQTRDSFVKLASKYRKSEDRLVVHTCVHNPVLLH